MEFVADPIGSITFSHCVSKRLVFLMFGQASVKRPDAGQSIQVQGQSHSHFSRVQATALADVLRAANLSADHRAVVSTQLVGMPWAECDLQLLLGTLAADVQPPKRRRVMQVYTTLTNHLPDTVWDTIAECITHTRLGGR